MRRSSLFATLMLAMLAIACVPETDGFGRVMGVVTDPITERPLADVRVRAHDQGETRTDSTGHFELSVRAGEHRLWLDRVGYVDAQRANVRVHAGEVTEVDPQLFPVAPADEDVVLYFARQPVRRHAHPAHERPTPTDEVDSDIGAVRAAIHEPPTLPTVIRVWRSSRAGALAPSSSNGWADNSCHVTAEVEEHPLEEYVKGVIPREWLPSWHPESLRAGAIAARSYGSSHALSGGRWACADVDDGTVTQVYRDDRYQATDEAVDATASMAVMRGESVVRAEYSAENSDPTAFDVSDPTCTGEALHGHGRGMCQWGTQRWASGICANEPCNFGAFGSEPKTYTWMVEHYYPEATVVGGSVVPLPPCGIIPAAGGILDDAGPCFTAFGPSASWRSETAGWEGGLRWTNAFMAATPSNWGRWRMHFEAPNRYRIEIYIDGAFGDYPATRYSVRHRDGIDEIIVDQGSADGWVTLGTFDFGDDGEVAVFDNYAATVAADQHIVADAVRVSPEGDAPPIDAGPRDAMDPVDGGDTPPVAEANGGCCHVGPTFTPGAPAGLGLVLAIGFVMRSNRRRAAHGGHGSPLR